MNYKKLQFKARVFGLVPLVLFASQVRDVPTLNIDTRDIHDMMKPQFGSIEGECTCSVIVRLSCCSSGNRTRASVRCERSRDGGGGASLLCLRARCVRSQSRRESSGRCFWGRGSSRRKENSARKKLETKRKESEEKLRGTRARG